ncbi:MAG: hypothetical protein A2381_16385 [Bdellovibrionales bacterium RIFOXYB1_FULL_37_110]|nr:MAG: hypothetical protein A2417_14270 [Bdellovibrionales bacterium RIFOXYC1_FULL_37_79]OFZ61074.1 MAG: hypothetical protein A2381_16385 [Bdellovibrionales bacterium RIFOXYB1_FULL_37_110]
MKKNKFNNLTKEQVFSALTKEQLGVLSRDEMIKYCLGLQDINQQLLEDLSDQKKKELSIQENYLSILSKIFKPSVHLSKGEVVKIPPKKKNPSNRKKGSLKERYPNLEVKETEVANPLHYQCPDCNTYLSDTGLTEDSEILRVIPRRYYIEVIKRHKYSCRLCRGTMICAPLLPRIAPPGSIYSDEVIIYWALSKYVNFVPMGRMAAISKLEGFDFPANSMIETTHYLASFLEMTYWQCKEELLQEKQIKADESPLRMLEGSEKMSWQLWAFIARFTAYYEAHDTRAGDVCTSVLVDSKCEGLLTDVFSGYGKSVREINIERELKGLPLIEAYHCNTHALRKFKEPYLKDPIPQYGYYYKKYQEIYKLEKEGQKANNASELLKCRSKMTPIFEEMKSRAKKDIKKNSSKGHLVSALNYFLNNYFTLTKFISNADVDIDNNASERRVKNHALGRKNWYGNHSVRGANTYVILYTMIESCRLNAIDPYKYITELVQSLHQFGNEAWKVSRTDPRWQEVYDKRKIYSFTPKQYREKHFPVLTS